MPTIGDAGDMIAYTTTFSNAAGANRTTAFDLVLTDPLPADMTLNLGSISVASPGGCATGVDSSGSAGNNVLVRIATIPAGCAVTVTYSATLDASVVPAQVLPNTANLTYTSLPGPNGTTSNPTGSSTLSFGVNGAPGGPQGERTGSGAPAYNDYFDSDGASVTVPGLTPVKSIQTTSDPNTPGSSLTIGEVVRYRLAVQVAEATLGAFTIVDTLPVDLSFAGDARLSFVANTAFSAPADLLGANGGVLPPFFVLPAGRIGVVGQTVTLSLGDLVNNDTDLDAEFVVIEFDALVVNSALNSGGQAKDNDFEVSVTGSPTVTSNNVTATIVEPRLTLDKQIAALSAIVDAGGTVTYRATIAHDAASTSAAHDVRLIDILPADLALDLLSVNVTLLGGAAGVDTNGSAGNTLDVTIGTIPLGGSVIVEYTATINGSVTPAQAINNTADVTWTSLPGVDGNERNGSGAPGFNNYSATDIATFDIRDPFFSKSIESTSHAGTLAGDLVIGEEVTFGLFVTLPEGTTPALRIRMTCRFGLSYVDPAATRW